MIRVIKQDKKLNIKIFVLILIVLVPTFSVLAKYIYEKNYDSYFKSKHFYFYSDVLKREEKTYNIDNWDGISYDLDIDIHNNLNDLVWTEYNIDYDVKVDCSSNIICNLTTPTSDTLTYDNTKSTTNKIKLNITSNASKMEEGETATIFVVATSKSKYQKKLSAKFILKVGNYGIKYSIEDSINRYYLTLQIYNATDSTTKKLALNFDPSKVGIDNTNSIVLNSLDTSIRKDSQNRITGIDLEIGPSEEMIINFFKKNITEDYTYPINNSNSIISIEEIE